MLGINLCYSTVCIRTQRKHGWLQWHWRVTNPSVRVMVGLNFLFVHCTVQYSVCILIYVTLLARRCILKWHACQGKVRQISKQVVQYTVVHREDYNSKVVAFRKWRGAQKTYIFYNNIQSTLHAISVQNPRASGCRVFWPEKPAVSGKLEYISFVGCI